MDSNQEENYGEHEDKVGELDFPNRNLGDGGNDDEGTEGEDQDMMESTDNDENGMGDIM